MEKIKHLDAKGKGQVDYDYKNDILFFKIKGREYMKSIDLDDVVVDVDKEGFITAAQIFDASKLFKIDKKVLMTIRSWQFEAKAENNVISLNITFEMLRRNKVIVEKGQNLIRETTSSLGNSEVMCKVIA